MADLLRTGTAWLAAQRKAHAASQVVYRRLEDEIEIAATKTAVRFEREQDVGEITESQQHDWLVNAADLVIDGEVVKPEKDDQIVETVEGVEHVYDVLPIAGEPCWRNSDPHGNTLRIHTRYAGAQ